MAVRRRILFVVEPALYESALSHLVESWDVDVFTSYGRDEVVGRYDIAVSTGDLPASVAAHVEIRLPAAAHGTGELTVRGDRRLDTISVGELGHILAVIERALMSQAQGPLA